MHPPPDPPQIPEVSTSENPGALTPPVQTTQPGEHRFAPYPRNSPLRKTHGSPALPVSQPPTPVKGLTNSQVKTMGKSWNSAAKIVGVVKRTVDNFAGEDVEGGEILEFLKELLDEDVKNLCVSWVYLR